MGDVLQFPSELRFTDDPSAEAIMFCWSEMAGGGYFVCLSRPSLIAWTNGFEPDLSDAFATLCGHPRRDLAYQWAVVAALHYRLPLRDETTGGGHA